MTMHSTDRTRLFSEHKTLYECIQTSFMQFCKCGNCVESFDYIFPTESEVVTSCSFAPVRGVFRCRKANSGANSSVEAGWLEGVKVSLSHISFASLDPAKAGSGCGLKAPVRASNASQSRHPHHEHPNKTNPPNRAAGAVFPPREPGQRSRNMKY